jgi:hypothetical protein
LVLALAAGACTGPAEISLGGKTPPSTERFLSPTGNDNADGTRAHPWKTFAVALPRLSPGSMLTLLSSPKPYDDATTGSLNVKCAAVTANSAAPNAVLASNGLPGMEITVKADVERQVFLAGNGSVPPLSIDACQSWIIEGLHVESQDVADNVSVADSGSVVVLGSDNQNVVLRRLLASHPNRYKHSHVIRIGDRSSGITVEECELYDFHHNGFETWRTSSIFFHRNYINSRSTPDIANGYGSEDPLRGDYGVFLEETNGVYAENNVVEGVAIGFGVVGRYLGVDAAPVADPIDNNNLLGNVVYKPALMGFRLDSRCQMLPSCDPSHTVSNTKLTNDVVIGGAVGVSDAGSVGTHIDQLSTINAARGVAISKEPQNGGLLASATTTNTLVAGFQSVAFGAAFEATWGFDHCAASGGYDQAADYVTNPVDPQRITNNVTLMPQLGTCLVYLPAQSPLKKAGASGSDVGASVLYRYDRGMLSTTTLLWSATGTFPCGAPVEKVNDDPATGCLGLGQPTRLNVGTNGTGGCPFP